MITKNEKREKDSRQDSFFITFLSVLAVLLIGFLAFSNIRINQKRKEMYLQIDHLQKEIQTLEERKQQILNNISQGSKEAYLEKEARERLGLKKPGEEVVVIKREEEEKEEKKETFWDKVSQKTLPITEGTTKFFEKLKFW